MSYYQNPNYYYNAYTQYLTNNPYPHVQNYSYGHQTNQNHNQPTNFYNATAISYPEQCHTAPNIYHNRSGPQYYQNKSHFSHVQGKLNHNNKSYYYSKNESIKLAAETNGGTTYGCHVCSLYFDKKQKLDKHLKNDHIPCLHEGCSFSAPLQILEIHALKHLKNDKGESIVDSPEEIRLWRERRRMNHPLNPHRVSTGQGDSKSTRCSLEDLLRNSINTSSESKDPAYFNDQGCTSSALVPLLNKITPAPSSLYSFLEPQKADRKIQTMEAKFGGPYSYSTSVKKKFNICNTFLRKKTCKYGSNCAFSHDLTAFKRRKKLQFNLQVPKRPPLLYRLLKPQILIYEEMLVRGIVYIVKSNFLQPPKMQLIEELNESN